MESPLKIILPGGSGQVGTLLARAFHAAGHDVTVLSRRPATEPWRSALWDGKTLGPWAETFESADVVVNLAGKNVNCRYTPENQREIMASRVDSTRVVGEAIARAEQPPKVWLQSSTATLYAHRYDAPNDEHTGIIGGHESGAPEKWRFSVEVAKAWEQAVDDAPTPATRKVKLRSAMIMSPDAGGIFDTLLRLVRLGLGGPAGNGRQYVSWIHEMDFVEALYWLTEHPLEGVVNLSSPNPLPYTDFMKTLRTAWGMPVGLPATEWMLAVGTFLLRTETELVLKSRRVVPTRLQESGFSFEYPDWRAAAENLCRRWREARGAGSARRT